MMYRSWLRSEGFGPDVFDGRPVIGIASTWSELVPCNAHLDRVAAAVKRGVWQAGGFPLEFPTMGTGETLMRPTAMLFRNLLAYGFEGPVYPVHPTSVSVAGVRAYSSVLEVPDAVDLAIVVVPAADVLAVARECAEKGVRGMIVISAGFARSLPSAR